MKIRNALILIIVLGLVECGSGGAVVSDLGVKDATKTDGATLDATDIVAQDKKQDLQEETKDIVGMETDLSGPDSLEVILPDIPDQDTADQCEEQDLPGDTGDLVETETDILNDADNGEEEVTIGNECSQEINPKCEPNECTDVNGKAGKCGLADGSCACVVSKPQCSVDSDCLDLEWNIRCDGHWDCVDGQCQAKCGDPCGNGKCEPNQGEGPDTCASDCTVCKSNQDCSEKDFCEKKVGDCAGTGICTPRPSVVCPLGLVPVCGCDGNTYDSSCKANKAGVNVMHNGQCDPCEKAINPQCKPNECTDVNGKAGQCGLANGLCVCVMTKP